MNKTIRSLKELLKERHWKSTQETPEDNMLHKGPLVAGGRSEWGLRGKRRAQGRLHRRGKSCVVCLKKKKCWDVPAVAGSTVQNQPTSSNSWFCCSLGCLVACELQTGTQIYLFDFVPSAWHLGEAQNTLAELRPLWSPIEPGTFYHILFHGYANNL